MRDTFHGMLRANQPVKTIRIKSGTQLRLPAGTPLFKKTNAPDPNSPMVQVQDPNSPYDSTKTIGVRSRNLDSLAAMPTATSDSTAEFIGATIQNNSQCNLPVLYEYTYPLHVRVQGPVAVGDSVGRSNGNNYLVKTTNSTAIVGTAMEPVTAGQVRLIKVDRQAGSGGGDLPCWL